MLKKTEPEIEIVDDVPQGSAEWRALRCGKVTASNFADVMAAGEGKVRGLYMRKVAGEIITGLPAEDFKSRAMERGSEMEDSLRAAFQIETGLDPRQVAFVRRRRPYGIIGASPDALIGDQGGLEIKKEEPHILIETLRSGRVPPQHMPQVQGNMLVTGRPFWWLAIGFPGMPMAKWKIKADTAYQARLEVALETFTQELGEMVDWLRTYGRET
jgi:predicted phage-related endonuclease